MTDEVHSGQIVTIDRFDRQKFVVGNVIEGGMGTVFQLVPINPMSRVLALKTFQEHINQYLFEKEAQLWVEIGQHKNIAEVIWYGDWKGKPIILTEWYSASLMDMVGKVNSIKELEVLIVGVAQGLKHAYEKIGLIHQDIKPQNILLDNEKQPRISDFGISAFVGEIQTGIRGTKAYMAPELFLGTQPSIITDIYSLGVTFYQLITDHLPVIDPDTDLDNRKYLLERKLKRFGVEGERIAKLVFACTSLSPMQRPKTYEEIIQKLSIQHQYQQSNKEKLSEIEFINKALVYRNRGELRKATDVLQDYLIKDPGNPIILNSLATTYMAFNQIETAVHVLSNAVEILKQNRGRHKGQIYLDPIMNLSLIRIKNAECQEANRLVKLVFDWAENEMIIRIPYYPEIGWWYIYNENFNKGCEYISSLYRLRKLDQLSLAWYTLSSWLSSDFIFWLNRVSQSLMKVNSPNVAEAISICFLANFLDNPVKKQLFETAIRSAGQELKVVEADLGEYGSFAGFSLSKKMLHVTLNSIDKAYFGGKFAPIIWV